MKTDFSKIVFEPDRHTYTYKRRSLISVTTLLKWVVPEFETEKMLKRQAYRTNRSVEDIRKEWDTKRDEGLDKGTRVHNYVENVMEGNDISCMKELNDHIHEMQQFDVAWARLREKLKAQLYKKEWTIGDVEYGVAGRVDAIISMHLRDKPVKCLFDWKTGKFMTRKYAREYLLPPFDDLPNCEEVKYSIQLSLYRLIIDKNSDENIHSCYIMHLPADGKYQLYNAIDLRDRIKDWLVQLNCEGRIGDPETDKEANNLIKTIDGYDLGNVQTISPHTRKALMIRAKKIYKSCKKYQ